MDENLVSQAKKRALHLLERMDRTEAQLREKLRQSQYREDVIEEAVAYMKQFHYIDDFRYACNYVRYRGQNNSRRKLALDLAQKGISREIVEQALEEEYLEENESAGILKWLEKKQYDPECADMKQKQKMYQFLVRRGFRSEDILKVL